MLVRSLVFSLVVACLHVPALAQVWKYVDSNGVTHFTNEAVSSGQQIISAYGQSSLGDLPEKQAVRTLAKAEASSAYKDAQPHLQAAAQAHGLDYALVKAVAATESAFNANAVSPKGAVGLMQVMPATAAQYGLSPEPGRPLAQKLKEPEANVQVGTRYLADLIRLYPGRLDLALAAYNAGQGAVSRAGHQIPNYRETQDYVRKVMAVYKVLQARG